VPRVLEMKGVCDISGLPAALESISRTSAYTGSKPLGIVRTFPPRCQCPADSRV